VFTGCGVVDGAGSRRRERARAAEQPAARPHPRPGGTRPRSRRGPPGAHTTPYPSKAGSQYPPHHQPNGTRSSHNQPDQVRVMGLALRPHLGGGRERRPSARRHGRGHGARAAREGRTPAAPCGELTLRWPCGKLGSKLTPASTHQADLVASTAVRSAKRASDDTTNDSDGLGGPAPRPPPLSAGILTTCAEGIEGSSSNFQMACAGGWDHRATSRRQTRRSRVRGGNSLGACIGCVLLGFEDEAARRSAHVAQMRASLGKSAIGPVRCANLCPPV